jgi:hypothetical protein
MKPSVRTPNSCSPTSKTVRGEPTGDQENTMLDSEVTRCTFIFRMD